MTTEELNTTILALEAEQAIEWQLLKTELHTTYEKIQPLNLLKNTLSTAIEQKDLKTTILNSLLGLASGYLAKKVLVGESTNPLRKLLGLLVEFTVGNKVVANAEDIKSVSTTLLSTIVNSLQNHKN